MSEAHAFLLLGGYRVIARNWGFLADLAGRGLRILLITSEQWRADTTAAMARGEGPGTYLTDAAFVTGEVGIEGSFTSGVVAHVQRWQQEYDIVGVYAAGEMLVEQTGIVADALGLPGPGVRAARVCRNKTCNGSTCRSGALGWSSSHRRGAPGSTWARCGSRRC